MSKIIEIISYRTNDGVSDDDYIAAAKGLDTYIDRCGGLISRSLYKDDDGLWHEQMLWTDKAAYDHCNSGFMASPEGQAVIALIAKESLSMGHRDAALARVALPEMA